MPRKKTRTSAFGSPGRVGHDASAFYSTRLYADQPQAKIVEYTEKLLPSEKLDTIFHGSSEQMN